MIKRISEESALARLRLIDPDCERALNELIEIKVRAQGYAAFLTAEAKPTQDATKWASILLDKGGLTALDEAIACFSVMYQRELDMVFSMFDGYQPKTF